MKQWKSLTECLVRATLPRWTSRVRTPSPAQGFDGLGVVAAPNEGIGAHEGAMRESERSATQFGVAVADAERDVDVTLIDEMLRLTPAQRLRQNDRVASLATRLREAFEVRNAACPSRET